MNEKSIFEDQENKINSLTEKSQNATDSIAALSDQIAELNYFTLLGNDNAMSYFENIGYEAKTVEGLVTDFIYDKNIEANGNSLIPYESLEGTMRINKIKFLNHRWIVADFSDGDLWGEVLLEYFFDDKNVLQLTRLGSILYAN